MLSTGVSVLSMSRHDWHVRRITKWKLFIVPFVSAKKITKEIAKYYLHLPIDLTFGMYECTTRNVAQRVHLYRSGRRLRQQIGNFIKVIRCFVLRRQKEFR